MASVAYSEIGAYGFRTDLNGIPMDDQNSHMLQLDTLLEYADLQDLTPTRQGQTIAPCNNTYNHYDNNSVRGHTHKQSDFGMTESCFSQYAMDAIFKNLIYPDVCQGQFLTLDTLVQDVPQSAIYDHGKPFFQPQLQSTKIAGKRKRSQDILCDETYEETGKKRKVHVATVRKFVTRHMKS